MRKGIGYIRVSRLNGRGGDTFIAPEVQRETIERVAAMKGITIVEWIEDIDQSGAKYERPGFQRALEMVEAAEAEVIVVAKQTRFARSVLDALRAIKRLGDAGGGFIAADTDLDTSTPVGKMVQTVLMGFAEFELDIIREQWSAARSHAVDRGIYIAHTAPIGYRFDAEHRLEPDPATVDALRQLFAGRADGMTWEALAEQWLEMTGREIASGSLGRVIANRAYLGEAKSGKHVNTDSHEPLVTLAEWTAAQNQKAQRSRRSETSTALLGAATLRCGSCGRPMSFRGGEGRQYVCNRQNKGEVCPAPVAIDGAKLDEFVAATILEELAEYDGTKVDDGSELVAAEARLEQAIAEREAFVTSVSATTIGVDAFRIGAEQRTAEVDEAQAALRALQADDRREQRLAGGVEVWERADLEERRQFVAAAFATVTVHRAARQEDGRWAPIAERVSFDDGSATSPALAAA